MYRHYLIISLCLVCFACANDPQQNSRSQSILPTSATADLGEPVHLQWARKLIATIKPEDNEYGSSPVFVNWKGVNGNLKSQNRSKCSSFLSALLVQSYQVDLTTWMGCSSPLAKTYHDKIVAEDRFLRVRDITKVQPGDILAKDYIQDTCSAISCGLLNGCGSSSGHVAIISGFPKQRTSPKSPIIKGTIQWDVDIIDSSRSYHGSQDTRYLAEGKEGDGGVGEGTMRIYTDEQTGELTGYTWSTYSNSTYYPLTGKRHFVIGRYTGTSSSQDDAPVVDETPRDYPAHVTWAKKLLSTLKPENNLFGSKPLLQWKGVDGAKESFQRSRSSTFITKLLAHSYQDNLSSWMGCSSPLAKTYHDAIVEENGFQRIKAASKVKVGDLIALDYLRNRCPTLTCSSTKGCGSSGSVMLVAKTPEKIEGKKPFIEGTTQWSVDIIDSSSSYHGSQDTRLQGNKRGLGLGTMRLYTNTQTGRIQGYTWSTYASSKYYDIDSKRHIAIGRRK